MNVPRDYEAGAQLTVDVVGRFAEHGPEFAMPPREVALLASLTDVGKYLARNDVARSLLLALEAECLRRKLEDFPTAMMLRVALEHHGIEPQWMPFDQLGIPGELMPMGRGARA